MLFRSEIDFIRSAGGVLIRVKRGDDPSPEELSKMHISETAWNSYDPDFVIHNEGTKDDLKENVKIILTQHEKQYKLMHRL
mgnify:FL=1